MGRGTLGAHTFISVLDMEWLLVLPQEDLPVVHTDIPTLTVYNNDTSLKYAFTQAFMISDCLDLKIPFAVRPQPQPTQNNDATLTFLLTKV